eukprot:4121300-Alexandrium_andersonii.AAC.1
MTQDIDWRAGWESSPPASRCSATAGACLGRPSSVSSGEAAGSGRHALGRRLALGRRQAPRRRLAVRRRLCLLYTSPSPRD